MDDSVYGDHGKCGSNGEIKYSPDNGIFVRTYWTGAKQNRYGMQIYDKGYNLVGDIRTPEKFLSLGYCSPYFYGVSALRETENETWVTFYKLKIAENPSVRACEDNGFSAKPHSGPTLPQPKRGINFVEE
jgi:hypothetical protein